MTIIVLNNQSLLDVAIQTTGKPENYLKIAMANNLIPTDVLVPGTEISIPEELEIDADIVRYYKANKILPATALGKTIEQLLEKSCEEKLYDCFKD